MRALWILVGVLLTGPILTSPQAAAAHPAAGDSITIGSTLYTLNLSTFWGAVGQFGANPSTPALRADTNATPLQVFRFADGMDSTNLSANETWTPGASSATAGTIGINVLTDWQFCEELRSPCTFVFQLPGETDSAGDVRSALQFLQIHDIEPAYYSIGNEPSLWKHWGEAWSTWATSDSSKPTGLQYAQEVQQLVPVIRAIVPGARIIGLEDDQCSNDSYVQQVAKINGPNLSAIACHSYSANSQDVAGAGLQQFYNVLTSTGANPATNVPKVRAGIRFGCGSCSLPVWIDEDNAISGADPAHFSRYTSSYPDFVLTAGDLLDAIAVGTPHVLFFQYWAPSGSTYGMVNGSGLYLRPTYFWYSAFADLIPSGPVSVNQTSVAPSTQPLVAQFLQSNSTNSVVVVNGNATTPEIVTLPVSMEGASGGRSVYWDNNTLQPSVMSWTAAPPSLVYMLGPQSVLLVDSSRAPAIAGTGGSGASPAPPSGTGTNSSGGFLLQPDGSSAIPWTWIGAGAGLLGVVALAAVSRHRRLR
ncbi:MAG TPA: hypothetical protein VGU43_04530 [Thermoplasmata archaeon]|nr:hypothetical protein [Thermoplasmata archaeon]